MTFGQGQEMTLTLNTPFPLKSLCDQSCPCRKIAQDQPMVMIYTNYDGPESPDATYQVSLKSVHRFQRRRFLRFLQYMGMAAILVV